MPATKRGERPRYPEATRAMCYECMGDMIDGRADCEITTCPLYFFQPYRKLEPDYTWRTEGSHLKANFKKLRQEFWGSKNNQEKEEEDLEKLEDAIGDTDE